ncbi:hypothetical protein BWQ96_00453 [Gracilariopsis chorda]|uniref:Uncharacterized protein n=1 Tax=Gracilariopsis chorda TaxID=448386 RepID=A0A2V3J5V2_9FLOR|nr:hypothetical protein BWQ96_00453 [Gracilariopsis chorda]|eukprot:PXF49801.1 hypothetical protein BWQ96_00453 [Gracilariopsis chorda]
MEKMRKECSSFHTAIKRVEAVDLTGSPKSQDLERCASAFYNLGSGVTLHLYDIIRNPNRAENALDDGPDVHEAGQCSQLKGNKATKDETEKATKRKKAGMDDGMGKSAADMEASVSKFEQKFSNTQLKKAKIMQRNIDLEE